MSDLHLVLSYLRARVLITTLTVISMALGLALATIVLILSRQTQRTLSTETAAWDIVIGSKGSPLQVVLNSLYYLDAPTGNVDIAVWERLRADPLVDTIIPLTMGDNYFGSPIVGTVPDFFAGRRPARGDALFARGQCFSKPFEVVAGAEIAAANRLQLGQQIVGAHGWGNSGELHPQFPYTVVGILAPTGSNLDRAVFTDYHSTWLVHAHEDEHEHAEHGAAEEQHEEHGHDPLREVTSLLVRLHQPGARFRLVQDINAHQMAQAVIPVDEIDKLSRTFIAPLQGILLLVAYLVVLVSALTILISLYHAIHQRRHDLAIMRSLGATRADVFRVVALEAAMLSGLGVCCGWLLGHGLIAFGSGMVLSRFGIALDAWQFESLEAIIAVSVWGLGIVAGLLPAIIAYRLSVADTTTQE